MREIPPFGYCIQYANACDPCWLVMRWGVILYRCCTLEAAYRWLREELEEVH